MISKKCFYIDILAVICSKIDMNNRQGDQATCTYSVSQVCLTSAYMCIYSVCKISNDGLCCSFLQGALPSFGLNQNFVVGLHWGGGEYCFQRCFINTCWGNNHFAQSWDLNGELPTGQSENIAVVPVWSRLDHKS